MNTLNRRDFLKLTGLVVASGVMLSAYQAFEHGGWLLADPQVRFGKSLIRGNSHGDILSSSDEGKTWNKLVGFGEHNKVIQLMQNGEQIYANLGPDNDGFWLKSADGQKWYIV